MGDEAFLKINDDPFEFRDTLYEGIQYSRSQCSYRFKLLRVIRYFAKKPALLVLSKCAIGFVLVSLPIIAVNFFAHYYHFLTLIPVIISESLSIVVLLCLFIQKLYNDNKYHMNISPYWVRKAYYDMLHFIFVHSFILWIVLAIYYFDNYIDTLNIVNDNTRQGRELEGCIIIKIILILKYHNNDPLSKTSIYVGKYSSNVDNFFYEVQNKAQMVLIPILILASIMLGKAIIIQIKYTFYYIGIVVMLVLPCISILVEHHFLYDKDYYKPYKEWFNYFYLIPPILALCFYANLLWKIVDDGIKKKKIYDYGDKRPLYVTKLTVQLLFGCSILGCFCIIVSLICFLIVPIKKEFTYYKIETVAFFILGGIGAITFGSIFLIGNMILAMLLKPISKEYGRKKLVKQFCIHYTFKSNKKSKAMKKFLKSLT